MAIGHPYRGCVESRRQLKFCHPYAPRATYRVENHAAFRPSPGLHFQRRLRQPAGFRHEGNHFVPSRGPVWHRPGPSVLRGRLPVPHRRAGRRTSGGSRLFDQAHGPAVEPCRADGSGCDGGSFGRKSRFPTRCGGHRHDERRHVARGGIFPRSRLGAGSGSCDSQSPQLCPASTRDPGAPGLRLRCARAHHFQCLRLRFQRAGRGPAVDP